MKFPQEILEIIENFLSKSLKEEVRRKNNYSNVSALNREFQKNEKLYIGVIKEMTGNDSFFTRNIYDKDDPHV